MELMFAIRRCLDHSIDLPTIDQVRNKLAAFLEYYEHRFYRQEYRRLPACLPVFHQIAHVADYLQILGPMGGYSQWVMERMCGLLVSCAHNRQTANRNMEINILLQEQRNLIPYLRFRVADKKGEHEQPEALEGAEEQLDDDEDPDGNVHLFRFFMNLISDNTKPVISRMEKPKLIGPAKKLKISTGLHSAISNYRYTKGDFLLRSDGELDRVTEYASWAACEFPNTTANSTRHFKVISKLRERSNSTRIASYVRLRGGYFGEVKYFFSMKCESGNEHQLAYVEQWRVQADGKLAICSPAGKAHVLYALGDVLELVGLVKKDNRMYIVRENMPVFLA
jgi:hypothetical protein